MESVRVATQVRDLQPGDTLGSGFTVQRVYALGSNETGVIGSYVGKSPITKTWGSSTTVRVTRARG